ncbi:MAG: DUF2079 domain-containing protein [Deltaproteobacteria bacterium]|nr:DUF2079 domain-containing protein [Deltaproteobacteria bacterium]
MADPAPAVLLAAKVPILAGLGLLAFALGMTALRRPLALLAARLDVRSAARAALAAGIVIYLIWIGGGSLVRHGRLETQTYDLGNVEQSMWNTLHGDFFRMTTDPELESNIQLGTTYPDLPDSRWAFHVEPILLAALPVYGLFPRAETLLLLQTLLLALGAIPVYIAAADVLGRRSLGVAFAWVYLLSPMLQRANLFEFHAFVLAVPFLLGAFALARRDRGAWAMVCVLLALACREDIVGPVAMLGLIWLFGGQRRLGLATLAVALIWGAVVFKVILPGFNPDGYIYTKRLALAESPGALVRLAFEQPGLLGGFLTRPERLAYYAYLLLPFAGLPIAAPQLLALGAPTFIGVIFSTHGEGPLLLGHYHYHALILVGLVLGAMGGLAAVAGRQDPARRKPFALAAALAMFVLAIGTGLTWRSDAFTLPPGNPAREAAAAKARALIPPGASVAASYDLGAQVAARRDLFTLYSPKLANAAYVFLSDCRKPGCDGLPRDRYDALIGAIRDDPGYEVAFEEAGIVLLRKREAGP